MSVVDDSRLPVGANTKLSQNGIPLRDASRSRGEKRSKRRTKSSTRRESARSRKENVSPVEFSLEGVKRACPEGMLQSPLVENILNSYRTVVETVIPQFHKDTEILLTCIRAYGVTNETELEEVANLRREIMQCRLDSCVSSSEFDDFVSRDAFDHEKTEDMFLKYAHRMSDARPPPEFETIYGKGEWKEEHRKKWLLNNAVDLELNDKISRYDFLKKSILRRIEKKTGETFLPKKKKREAAATSSYSEPEPPWVEKSRVAAKIAYFVLYEQSVAAVAFKREKARERAEEAEEGEDADNVGMFIGGKGEGDDPKRNKKTKLEKEKEKENEKDEALSRNKKRKQEDKKRKHEDDEKKQEIQIKKVDPSSGPGSKKYAKTETTDTVESTLSNPVVTATTSSRTVSQTSPATKKTETTTHAKSKTDADDGEEPDLKKILDGLKESMEKELNDIVYPDLLKEGYSPSIALNLDKYSRDIQIKIRTKYNMETNRTPNRDSPRKRVRDEKDDEDEHDREKKRKRRDNVTKLIQTQSVSLVFDHLKRQITDMRGSEPSDKTLKTVNALNNVIKAFMPYVVKLDKDGDVEMDESDASNENNASGSRPNENPAQLRRRNVPGTSSDDTTGHATSYDKTTSGSRPNENPAQLRRRKVPGTSSDETTSGPARPEGNTVIKNVYVHNHQVIVNNHQETNFNRHEQNVTNNYQTHVPRNSATSSSSSYEAEEEDLPGLKPSRAEERVGMTADEDLTIKVAKTHQYWTNRLYDLYNETSINHGKILEELKEERKKEYALTGIYRKIRKGLNFPDEEEETKLNEWFKTKEEELSDFFEGKPPANAGRDWVQPGLINEDFGKNPKYHAGKIVRIIKHVWSIRNPGTLEEGRTKLQDSITRLKVNFDQALGRRLTNYDEVKLCIFYSQLLSECLADERFVEESVLIGTIVRVLKNYGEFITFGLALGFGIFQLAHYTSPSAYIIDQNAKAIMAGFDNYIRTVSDEMVQKDKMSELFLNISKSGEAVLPMFQEMFDKGGRKLDLAAFSAVACRMQDIAFEFENSSTWYRASMLDSAAHVEELLNTTRSYLAGYDTLKKKYVDSVAHLVGWVAAREEIANTTGNGAIKQNSNTTGNGTITKNEVSGRTVAKSYVRSDNGTLNLDNGVNLYEPVGYKRYGEVTGDRVPPYLLTTEQVKDWMSIFSNSSFWKNVTKAREEDKENEFLYEYVWQGDFLERKTSSVPGIKPTTINSDIIGNKEAVEKLDLVVKNTEKGLKMINSYIPVTRAAVSEILSFSLITLRDVRSRINQVITNGIAFQIVFGMNVKNDLNDELTKLLDTINELVTQAKAGSLMGDAAKQTLRNYLENNAPIESLIKEDLLARPQVREIRYNSTMDNMIETLVKKFGIEKLYADLLLRWTVGKHNIHTLDLLFDANMAFIPGMRKPSDPVVQSSEASNGKPGEKGDDSDSPTLMELGKAALFMKTKDLKEEAKKAGKGMFDTGVEWVLASMNRLNYCWFIYSIFMDPLGVSNWGSHFFTVSGAFVLSHVFTKAGDFLMRMTTTDTMNKTQQIYATATPNLIYRNCKNISAFLRNKMTSGALLDKYYDELARMQGNAGGMKKILAMVLKMIGTVFGGVASFYSSYTLANTVIGWTVNAITKIMFLIEFGLAFVSFGYIAPGSLVSSGLSSAIMCIMMVSAYGAQERCLSTQEKKLDQLLSTCIERTIASQILWWTGYNIPLKFSAWFISVPSIAFVFIFRNFRYIKKFFTWIIAGIFVWQLASFFVFAINGSGALLYLDAGVNHIRDWFGKVEKINLLEHTDLTVRNVAQMNASEPLSWGDTWTATMQVTIQTIVANIFSDPSTTDVRPEDTTRVQNLAILELKDDFSKLGLRVWRDWMKNCVDSCNKTFAEYAFADPQTLFDLPILARKHATITHMSGAMSLHHFVTSSFGADNTDALGGAGILSYLFSFVTQPYIIEVKNFTSPK